ncbi:P-loop containing nucleoside triphosphate hydrolase protein [Stachybotrys elegans]|uniref:P-loop containing nucleoside triphosphate hydrolase protein n=1 Tax=Stachybotrys elegans TaxID=80388 RepID=A0A8K0T954_9HYPO|nr:P-loop containing nucleoside triphosphate hydrolase protein [Stachybotrys elegans]
MASSCASLDDTFGPHAGDCRGGFDLTLLFEESILILPLVSLLLLSAPLRLFFLLRKRVVRVEKSYLLHCKLVFALLFAGSQLASVVLWSLSSAVTTRASLPTAAVAFVSSVALVLLSYVEHVYSTRPSTIIELFLLFSILFDATRTRTLWLQGYNRPVAIATLVGTLLKIILIVFETVEKRDILRPAFKALPPEATSGVFSQWIFSWQIPLFREGYSKDLAIEDLFSLDKHLGSHHQQNLLKSALASRKKQGPLLMTVFKTLKRPLIAIVFPRLCFIGFTFCQPFLISSTLEWSQRPSNTPDMNEGYGLIGAFFFVFVGLAVTTGQHQHLTFRAITMMRGQLISALYDKATDLSLTAADPTSSLTLMSADIERIDMGWRTMHEIWANLIEIGIALYLLQRQLGIACLIPLGTALVSIIGSVIAVSFVMARQALWLEAIEKRVAVTSSMLGAMKGVKMCGLSDLLKARIQAMRVEELRISGKFRRLLIWNMGLAFLAPIIGPIVTFAAYGVMARNQGDGGTLDTNRVFTSLSLFALLQEPLSSFVMSLSTFMGSIGCFERIQEFLEADARVDSRINVADDSQRSSTSQDSSVEKEKTHPAKQEGQILAHPTTALTWGEGLAVRVDEGAFGYDTTKEPLLRNIHAEIPKGKFTMLVGPVGSGKSTLLKALLGEVNVMSGTIQIGTSEIAYCDQTPWHMNGTVRDSIVAFSGVDEPWYQRVLEACALQQDLTQFPNRDLTSIGSKGIVLSGGQSQRIALARAVYAQKDFIILDDIFSGLDAHTEDIVFHNLLGTHGILRQIKATVILASSRSKRLSYADHILCLNPDGNGCEQGTLKELQASGGYVSRLDVASADWTLTPPESLPSEPPKAAAAPPPPPAEDHEGDAGRRSGDVAIYTYYVRAIGWIPTMLFVLAICAYVVCVTFPTVWLGWWSDANADEPNQDLGYYLGIYAMLGGLALAFLVASCWQMIVTMVPLSGKNFHWSLLRTVLDAPMSFFAVTDSGITINRFSQDLQLIDMDLPITALNTFATFVLCIAQMVLIAVGSYYTAIAFPFLMASLWLVQHIYLRTSRQLRFMDLEAKSPLYAQFTESLNGLATLRAFGWRGALQEKNHELLDRSQRPYYLLYAVQRWLTFVLDMFVAGIAVLLIILITQLRGVLSSGMIGVALVNVITFSQSLKLLLTFWTNLETHIGAISRIKSFTSNTTSEHEPQEKELPPPSWPTKGAIMFDNVSAGYKKSEDVLKNLTLSIEAGQKIGICGRTGSGKSSLVSCLFRMIDLHGGRITVDGVDIATLPREEVRTRLIGVPQDAFLIAGSSVRLNADPSEKLADAAVEEALRNVELWDIVADKGGLDAPIEDLHLSHGQQQLFCLARAMLRPSPLLILDEATSSVDAHTDALIQRIMRERFAHHTVLAIAHKLESALDEFDVVVVLNAGRLQEVGPPRDLVRRGPDGSAFAALYASLTAGKKNGDAQNGEAAPKTDI